MTGRKQKNGRVRGHAGNGGGAHHHVSPMDHGTQTKNRKQKQRQYDRKQKQRGWDQ